MQSSYLASVEKLLTGTNYDIFLENKMPQHKKTTTMVMQEKIATHIALRLKTRQNTLFLRARIKNVSS